MVWSSSDVNAGDEILAEQYNDLRADVATVLDSAVPIGTILMWAGTSLNVPTGWALCDGSAVNRTTYATLYGLQANTFGSGDGSTTFNLPDMRDRFVVGAGTSYSQNSKGGSASVTTSNHTHTGPSHTHTGPSHTHTGPNHTHTGPNHTHDQGSLYTRVVGGDGGTYWSEISTGSWTTNKRVTGTYQSWSASVSGGADVIGDTGSGGTGNTGSGGTGNTGASGTGATGAGGTGNTSSNGSESLENRPPYIGLLYIIKIL